jgi:chromosomal replication initiator protein
MTPYIYPGLPVESRSIDTLIDTVGKVFNVTTEQIKSPTRERDVVDARKVCAYLLNKKRNLTTLKVGKILNRHHSSIIYLVKEAENLISIDKEFQERVHNLKFL